MYQFLVTETTKYGDDHICVAGALFRDGKYMGRKRLYLFSDKTKNSAYPRRGQVGAAQMLEIKEIQEGIVAAGLKHVSELYPREARLEDITVRRDKMHLVNVSGESMPEIIDMFRQDLPTEFDLKKHLPDFVVKRSRKIFCPRDLDFSKIGSLFYFAFSVADISFSETEGDSYLEFDDMRIKIISDSHNIADYRANLSQNPETAVACLGISQYFGDAASAADNGYYLLCNEIYFM